jgi:hypothetical protein
MSRKKKVAEAGTKLTPGRAKNLISVVKVVGPAVIPVVAPYVLQAAGAVRERWDQRKARQLGVDVANLHKFTGSGAKLHARISNIAKALDELEPTASEFVAASHRRLHALGTATTAAETMPTVQRVTAQRSISGQLTIVEDELVKRLGL